MKGGEKFMGDRESDTGRDEKRRGGGNWQRGGGGSGGGVGGEMRNNGRGEKANGELEA